MEIRKAERKKTKLKMALQGGAGAGKTYSALLMAFGLCQDWSKIVVIDTENGSADLYSHLGNYNILSLLTPFEPEKYCEAIKICENAGMEVIIIDSISHCWDYLIDVHANMQGNSFTNWAKITPRQNTFITKILQSGAHIIATMRVKQDYVLNQKDGKFVPEKVGLKAVQRDGVDYEFTVVLDLNIKHYAIASKDRTGLFMGLPEFLIGQHTGRQLAGWCNSGIEPTSIMTTISTCSTIEQLRQLFNSTHNLNEEEKQAFSIRKAELTQTHSTINHLKFNTNGSFTTQR